MENKNKYQELIVMAMPCGGYVVRQGTEAYRAMPPIPLFASSTIEEALGFVRDNLAKGSGDGK